jgi:hypothetical protein
VKLARGFVGRAFFLQLHIAGHVADARLTVPLTCSPLPLISSLFIAISCPRATDGGASTSRCGPTDCPPSVAHAAFGVILREHAAHRREAKRIRDGVAADHLPACGQERLLLRSYRRW